ncbi:MAG: hypothetical protein M1827_004669 [Pycnora praestabilis]|nr:MAG: hypothetical protein M1827_004669 [Pycnora praestabilis]
MPFKSPYPDLDIPKTDILTYLFPPKSEPSDEPIWLDAAYPSTYLTPRQLLQWIKRLAVGLKKQGLRPGDVAMIFTPNHVYVPVAYLGIVGYGAAFSGSNPAYTVHEMVYQIRNTQAKMMLVHPSLIRTALAASKEASLPKDRLFLFSDQECASIDGVQDWREMIGTPEDGARWEWEHLDAHESCTRVATINYSSGTTGLPKGVCVSHHNLIANVEQTIFMRDQGKPYTPSTRPPERWVGFLPLYHAFGQLYACLMACKLNVPTYIMKVFQYELFLQTIQNHKITTLQTAPPILVMLSKRPETEKYDLSSLTDVLCGAAPLSRELQNDVATRFKMQINQGWGMTEVTCGAIYMPGGTVDDTGSCGLLMPNVEAKMLDDQGQEVASEERGELYVRGPNICLRYWKNEQATAESIDEDKWLKTGDVAVRNAQGMLWIVDRKKADAKQEMIKVNGLQVAPAELEATLLEHPDIADVAVVGITIQENEWPRAYVSLKDHAKGQTTDVAIQEWMRQRVAKHKWLQGGVTFIDEVPKLASGKIQRKVMKDRAKVDAEVIQGRVRSSL